MHGTQPDATVAGSGEQSISDKQLGVDPRSALADFGLGRLDGRFWDKKIASPALVQGRELISLEVDFAVALANTMNGLNETFDPEQ